MYARLATLDDIPALIAINASITNNRWSSDKFTEVFDYGIPVIVICDKKTHDITGLLVYMIVLEEVRILHVVIAAAHRQRGVATKLLYCAFQEALNNTCRYALLEVNTINTKAVSLYTKLGFTVLCIRERYYDDAADAFFMQKVLDEPAIVADIAAKIAEISIVPTNSH
jgi:[ribosomal protein S18]-alanine N-acetyltransferase